MAKRGIKYNSVNPIKPVGLGPFVVETYPMTRYVDYTEADWRLFSDQLINNDMGQNWDTIVTWMLASSPFVQTLIDRRLNPVRALDFTIIDQSGEVDEKLTEELNAVWFRDFIDAAMMAIFQGYSAGVFYPEKNKLESYPIALIDPFNRALKHTPYDLNGKEIFNDYSNLFYVEYSSQHQTMLGLFQPIVKEYVGIAITLRNWLASGTRLAFPVNQIGYNGRAVERQQVTSPDGTTSVKEVNPNKETASFIARNIDPTTAIVSPFSLTDDGKVIYDIEVKQTEHKAFGDAYKTYYDYIDRAEQRVINLVLGATLTMTEGNSRALGEVHERVTSQYVEKDVRWIIEVLNNVLRPKLNLPDGYKFSYNSSNSMPLDDVVKVSDVMQQNGRQLSNDFFTAQGIPDQFYEERTASIPTPLVSVKEEKKIDVKEEKNFMRRVYETLTGRSRQHEVPQGVVYLRAPNLKDEVADEDVNVPPGPTYISDDEIRRMYESGEPRPVFVDLIQYRYYASVFFAPLRGEKPLEQLSVRKVTNIVDDDLVPRYMANIFQFSAAKDVSEQAAINDAIQRSLFNEKGERVSFAQFKRAVNNIARKFREDWLKTEYRTASMTAIMGQQWSRLYKDRDVTPYWQYMTQEDSRVRPEHAHLNGKVFRVDDPHAQALFPPNGWNCRCYYKSVSEYKLQSSGLSLATDDEIGRLLNSDVEKGFEYNAGISGIMPNKDSSYFQVLPSVNRLTYAQYKLDPIDKIRERSPQLYVASGTAGDITRSLKKAMSDIEGNILLYNAITAASFVLSKSLRDRLEIAGGLGVNLIGETVSNPDEMWGRWVDERNQRTVKGVMLRIGSNAVYAVEFEDNVITNAYIVRSSMEVDMMRQGALFVK